MGKLTHILSESELKSLETHRLKLIANDYKIAGKLFFKLKKLCNAQSIKMKMDSKGRIQKILITIDDQKVMAKPLIINNQVKFFYKKKYYTAEECINASLKYEYEMK